MQSAKRTECCGVVVELGTGGGGGEMFGCTTDLSPPLIEQLVPTDFYHQWKCAFLPPSRVIPPLNNLAWRRANRGFETVRNTTQHNNISDNITSFLLRYFLTFVYILSINCNTLWQMITGACFSSTKCDQQLLYFLFLNFCL